jgi:hypothetical protein
LDNNSVSTERRRRYRLLYKLEAPMFILAILWLIYLVLELTKGLIQTQERLVTAIWVLFIFEFLLKFILAPRKRQYVMHAWLTIVALVIPALRVFRLVQAIRILQLSPVATTTKFVRALTSTKRFVAEVREAQGSAFYVEIERSLTKTRSLCMSCRRGNGI